MSVSSATTGKHNLRAIFGALGDPTRYEIVKLLIKRPELCVSEVAEAVGISAAGVSQHMKVLEQSGLVRPQRMGQKTCYELQADDDNNRALLRLIK